MPIRLKDLQQQTRPLSVTYEDQQLALHYYPHRLTSSFYENLEEIPEKELHRRVDHQLAHLLADWDLLDEAGALLPPSAEVLRELSLGVKAAVLEAIAADLNPPGEPEKKG